MNRNISYTDIILLFGSDIADRIKGKLVAPIVYARIYSNPFRLMKNILKGDYPFKAKLRTNNTEILLQSRIDLIQLTMNLKRIYSSKTSEVTYDVSKDIIKFNFLDFESNVRQVVFKNGLKNGEVLPIFFDRIYDGLPAKGKIVVDIGANIGDSSIYFALRGATKVIGVEPFPGSYESAIRNVQLNNLSDKVHIKLAACSSSRGIVSVPSDANSNVGSRLGFSSNQSEKNVQVSLVTLGDIILEYDVRGDVMKMDCEGCEYDIILPAPEELLRMFVYIHIEYHKGYKNLKKKLEGSGFSVSVGRPKLVINPAEQTKMYIGSLRAIKV